jgi:hypothetical protein
VTATLPPEVQDVFARFVTTAYTAVDSRGQPVTWSLRPSYSPGAPCIDVTTELGRPEEAEEARTNPRVALLFCDPAGSGLTGPPQVLVQGTADVEPPGAAGRTPVHVRPERVYVWPEGDARGEPELLDAHMEEVRSGHVEEPAAAHAPAEGGGPAWDRRLYDLGKAHPTAVLSLVAPDGFPFSARVPVTADRHAERVRLTALPTGAPLQPGLACLTAPEHGPEGAWQRDLQVRGDLVEDAAGWAVVPHRVVELGPRG